MFFKSVKGWWGVTPLTDKIPKVVFDLFPITCSKESFQTCILKMGKKPPPPKPEELIEKLDEKVILKNIY